MSQRDLNSDQRSSVQLCTRCGQPTGLVPHECRVPPADTNASAWSPRTRVVVQSPGKWADGHTGTVMSLRVGNDRMCMVQLDVGGQFYARDDELCSAASDEGQQ